MLGLLRPGARVLLSESGNPKRKLAHTLELVDFHGTWVGVNTSTPLRLLRAAWSRGLLPEAAGYGSFRPEAARGDSRLDALLEGPAGRLWVECKTYPVEDARRRSFPTRSRPGAQAPARAHGHRPVGDGPPFLLSQRADAGCFAPPG
jgi:sugar fermentation stimulation protein A